MQHDACFGRLEGVRNRRLAATWESAILFWVSLLGARAGLQSMESAILEHIECRPPLPFLHRGLIVLGRLRSSRGLRDEYR